MRKSRFFLFCAVLLVILLGTGTAFARSGVDLDKTGSVTLRMTSGGELLEGGAVTFYYVADIDQTKGGERFRYTKAFQNAGYPLTDLSDPELALSLKHYAEMEGISGKEVKARDGKVVYNIPKGNLGLYLAVQTEASDGYLSCNPFLISVPQKTAGTYDYTVDGTPKMGIPDKEPEVPPVGPEEPEEPGDQPDRVPGDLDDDRGPGTDTDGLGDGDLGGDGLGGDGHAAGGHQKLPQTGTLNWPVPVLAVVGLAFLLGGFALARKDKRNENEK